MSIKNKMESFSIRKKMKKKGNNMAKENKAHMTEIKEEIQKK